MANSGELHSVDSAEEPKPSLSTPDEDEFQASLNSEAVTDAIPRNEDHNDPKSSQLQRHWDSPHHQRARPSNYRDSPIPFPPHLALSPYPTRAASSKELSTDIWRQAMFNKNNSLSETYLNTPSTPNNSVVVGKAFMSQPPAGPGLESAPTTGPSLDTTPPTGPSHDTTPVMDNTSSQPPRLNYSPSFNYNVNPDLSRLEDPDSPYNYPPNMTFTKRKFNNSYGSDQSSFSGTPGKQVKKRGKLESEFFENGRNGRMDRTLNGSLDISGPSDYNLVNRTWMPLEYVKKSLDKTWVPGATPSDSDDDNDPEMESTDLRGKSLDKTWVPEKSTNSDSEDDIASTSRAVQCHYCSTSSFNDKRQMFAHIIAVHGNNLTSAVSQTIPSVCTNCEDKNAPVAFCGRCLDDPYLCSPCVMAHKRVGVTKQHDIIFCSQLSSSQDEEDPYVMLENILDSVYPERANLTKQNDLPDPPEDPKLFCPLRCASSEKDIEDQVKTIRQESRKLGEVLNRTSGSESSSQSTLSCSSAPRGSSSSTSKSSSLNSSAAMKVLTEEILADNLLPIFNVDAVDVKTKVAVVIEMLLQMDAVHPSLFCDKRTINGFKSLLVVREVKFLHKSLGSLDQLVSSIGKKGIFFGLLKLKEELYGALDTIRKPNTRLRCAGSSAFNPTTIKKMASDILKKIDDLIG